VRTIEVYREKAPESLPATLGAIVDASINITIYPRTIRANAIGLKKRNTWSHLYILYICEHNKLFHMHLIHRVSEKLKSPDELYRDGRGSSAGRAPGC
jgi:hypothetical protein